MTLAVFSVNASAQSNISQALSFETGISQSVDGASASLGISSRSSAGLFYTNSNFEFDWLPAGSYSSKRQGLLAAATYAASPRLSLDAYLPYYSSYDNVSKVVGNTSTSKAGTGDLTLRARYAVLPEANGFALIGHAGITSTDSKSNNLYAELELQPMWRMANGAVLSLKAGLAHGTQTSSRQYASAYYWWPVNARWGIAPSISLTNNNAAGGYASYTQTKLGLGTAYAISPDWRITGTAYVGGTSAPSFLGKSVRGTGRTSSLVLGAARAF